MKAMKKILATLVCLCMVCSFAVLAVSAEGTGKITIQNPSNSAATVAGKTFQLYKVFDATVDGKNIAYSWYKKDGVALFENFFFGDGDGYNYCQKASGTAQEAVEKISQISDNLELSRLAENLHTYIKAIDPLQTVTGPSGATSVEFTGLSVGYYLVYDNTTPTGSSVRSAVMLKSVSQEVVITLKANRPQIEKYVLENDDTTWGKATSSSIGDEVKFKISTLVPSHTLYENYAYYIEDVLPEGLELKENSIVVYKNGTQVDNTHYALSGAGTGINGAYDFKVDFTGPITSKFQINDQISIEYIAIVDEEIAPHVANVNTATLFYHNDPTAATPTFGSSVATANVYTYMFVMTKFSEDANGNFSNHTRLAGAKFKFYKTGSSEPIKFVKRTVDGKLRYFVAPSDTTETTYEEIEVISSGTPTGDIENATYLGGNMGDITLFGLAEGTYEIEETEAPSGYVRADKRFKISIVDVVDDYGMVSTLTVTGEHEGNGSLGNAGGNNKNLLTWVDIANKPGSALPETGGMGTTLFTLIGIVLMAGAVAFFTSRKRSSVA